MVVEREESEREEKIISFIISEIHEKIKNWRWEQWKMKQVDEEYMKYEIIFFNNESVIGAHLKLLSLDHNENLLMNVFTRREFISENQSTTHSIQTRI